MVGQSELLECIAFVLYLETWTTTGEDVSEFSAQTLQRLWAKWKEECLPGHTSEHHGDCTNIPTPCLRCHMDELFVNAQRILNVMSVHRGGASATPTDPAKGLWWCKPHRRVATHVDERGRPCCDPKLRGILLPCNAIFAAEPVDAD